MVGLRKEGISMLEEEVSSARVDPFQDQETKEKSSKKSIVLSILTVVAVVTIVALFIGGGFTGAIIGLSGDTTSTGDSDNYGTESTTDSITGSGSNSGSEEDQKTVSELNKISESNEGPEEDKSGAVGSSNNPTLFGSEVDRTGAPISLSLEFSQVPNVDAIISLDSYKIESDNLGSSVRINGDLLEANSEVTLELSDFLGRLSFNEHSATLSGTVSQIHLNGVSLLSDQEIEIEIDSLKFNNIQTDYIAFSYLYLEPGNGNLEIEDRLTYQLKSDTLDLYGYTGQMLINPDEDLPLTLIGEAESLESSSSFLQFAVE